MNPSHRLRAKTEPFQPGDSQRIHKENGVCHQGSQVHNQQGVGRHDEVLQLKKVSSPRIQTRRPDIPRRIRYQNNMSISKVVTLQTEILQNWAPSKTVSLPTQVAPRIETVAPSIQHGQVIHHSKQSGTRKEATSPATTHCRQWRTVLGAEDTQRCLNPKLRQISWKLM